MTASAGELAERELRRLFEAFDATLNDSNIVRFVDTCKGRFRFEKFLGVDAIIVRRLDDDKET